MSKETKFKVGQVVWDVCFGQGVVEIVHKNQITVKFNSMSQWYDFDGCLVGKNEKYNRTLYFSEPKVIAETEPPFEPKLKKGDELLVTYLGKSLIVRVEYETEGRIVHTEDGHHWPKDTVGVKFYKLPEVELITFD